MYIMDFKPRICQPVTDPAWFLKYLGSQHVCLCACLPLKILALCRVLSTLHITSATALYGGCSWYHYNHGLKSQVYRRENNLIF